MKRNFGKFGAFAAWIMVLGQLLLSCNQTTVSDDTQSHGGNTGTVPAVLADREVSDARYISEVSSYRLDELENGMQLTRNGTASFVRGGQYYLETDNGFCIFDSDGSCLRQLTFLIPEENKLLTFTCNENGEFFILTTNGIGVALQHLGSDGAVLRQTDLPASFADLPDNAVRIMGDCIYVLQSNSFAVYDTALNLQKTLYFPGDAYGKMHIAEDGTVFLGGYVRSLYTVDLTGGVFVPYTVPDLPDEFLDASVHFDTAGKMYIADVSGIYALTNGARCRVLDWSAGAVKYSNLMDLRIFDEDTFAVFANNPQTFRASHQKLSALVLNGEPRRVISLGMATADNDGHLAALVFNFNSTNTKYYVEMFDYNDKYPYIEGKTDSFHMRDSVFEEFLTGTEPDIVVGLSALMYETLTDKGAFVDLHPYFGDRILPGVNASGRINGMLPSIPLGMTVTTLLSPVEGEGYLTMQSLCDAAAQLEEGQYLFSDPNAETYVYESGIRTFYDTESGTCAFDSAEFCDFIRFTEQIADRYTNTELGYYSQQYVNVANLNLSDPRVRDHLAEGTLRYLTAEIKDIAHLASAKFLLGGEVLSYCGLPTRSGGARIKPLYQTSITAGSDVQGGAAEFLSFALSEEAMTAPTLTRTFLPTTPDALRALLDQSSYFYYYADPADWPPCYTVLDSTPVVSGVTMFPVHTAGESDWERAVRYGGTDDIVEVVLTEQDKDGLLALLSTEDTVSSAADNTVISGIVEEELSAYKAGAKTLEEVAGLMQSRVWIYLNE